MANFLSRVIWTFVTMAIMLIWVLSISLLCIYGFATNNGLIVLLSIGLLILSGAIIYEYGRG